MAQRAKGTASITILFMVGSTKAREQVKNYASVLANRKSYADVRMSTTNMHGNDMAIMLSYEYTAHNHGNTTSDARRVIRKAFEGTDFGYEATIIRSEWEPAV